MLLTDLANEKSLEAKRNTLRFHFDRLQKDLSTLNRQEVEIIALERQVNLLEDKYTTYTHNLEQARVDRELKKDEITNINLIQPASLILKASSPKKALTLVLAFCSPSWDQSLWHLSRRVWTTPLVRASENGARKHPRQLSASKTLRGQARH